MRARTREQRSSGGFIVFMTNHQRPSFLKSWAVRDTYPRGECVSRLSSEGNPCMGPGQQVHSTGQSDHSACSDLRRQGRHRRGGPFPARRCGCAHILVSAVTCGYEVHANCKLADRDRPGRSPGVERKVRGRHVQWSQKLVTTTPTHVEASSSSETRGAT